MTDPPLQVLRPFVAMSSSTRAPTKKTEPFIGRLATLSCALDAPGLLRRTVDVVARPREVTHKTESSAVVYGDEVASSEPLR